MNPIDKILDQITVCDGAGNIYHASTTTPVQNGYRYTTPDALRDKKLFVAQRIAMFMLHTGDFANGWSAFTYNQHWAIIRPLFN